MKKELHRRRGGLREQYSAVFSLTVLRNLCFPRHITCEGLMKKRDVFVSEFSAALGSGSGDLEHLLNQHLSPLSNHTRATMLAIAMAAQQLVSIVLVWRLALYM